MLHSSTYTDKRTNMISEEQRQPHPDTKQEMEKQTDREKEGGREQVCPLVRDTDPIKHHQHNYTSHISQYSRFMNHGNIHQSYSTSLRRFNIHRKMCNSKIILDRNKTPGNLHNSYPKHPRNLLDTVKYTQNPLTTTQTT